MTGTIKDYSTVRLPQIGDWDTFDALRALQDKAIPEVLERAARSPFYRQRFSGRAVPRSVKGFAELPLTSKDELNQSYPFGMLAVSNEELDSYYESSGSGGSPTPAYYTEHDWQDLVERYARKVTGIYPSDIFFVRSPYALGLAAHLAQRSGRFCGATIVPGDNRSSVIPYARVVRVLRDVGVTLTWSNPTDCLLWSAAARRAGLDPKQDFPKLRALFVGGEPLSAARRRRISEIWGVPVIDEYGCTEIGSLAGRCSADRLHFWADRVKAEIYEPTTGSLKSSGIGELVLTPLYLEAMPLLRYNIHDLVQLTYDQCPCGWKLPLINVLGRARQGYRVGREGRVTQVELEDLVFSLPIEFGVVFWRARTDGQKLHIQIEVAEDLAWQARERLSEAVASQLLAPNVVEALPPGSLVPDSLLANSRQSLKPRSLYGPGESWDQAIIFSDQQSH